MSAPVIIQPYRPRHAHLWVSWPVGPELLRRAHAIERWYCRAHEVQVMSAVEGILEPSGVRPEYHLSISALPWQALAHARARTPLTDWVLREFGAEGFLEDNHTPGGKVRNFFRTVADRTADEPCYCVDVEPEIREDRGAYVWRPVK